MEIACLEELVYKHEEMVEDIYAQELFKFYTHAYNHGYLKQFYAAVHGVVKKKKFFFITINPDTSKVDFPVFKDRVQRTLNRTCFKNVIYTFEQRGSTVKEMGKGFHCHIISDKDSKLSPSQMQHNVFNSFKDICGNIKCIDVRVYDIDFRADKIDYLRGLKWDEGKEAAVRFNGLFRAKYKLQDIYGIDIDETTGESSVLAARCEKESSDYDETEEEPS